MACGLRFWSRPSGGMPFEANGKFIFDRFFPFTSRGGHVWFEPISWANTTCSALFKQYYDQTTWNALLYFRMQISSKKNVTRSSYEEVLRISIRHQKLSHKDTFIVICRSEFVLCNLYHHHFLDEQEARKWMGKDDSNWERSLRSLRSLRKNT